MRSNLISCVFYDPSVTVTIATPNTCVVTPRGSFATTIVPDTYSHKISAFGGFDSAKLSIGAQPAWLEDWALRGLGRHVEVYGSELTRCWEGFVNSITVQMGGAKLVIGPFKELTNSANGQYKRTYTGTNPPQVGTSRFVGYVENADSESRYGIRRTMLDLGSVTDVEALQSVTQWVYNRAWPTLQKTWSGKDAGATTLELEMLGYVHRMDYWYYHEGTAQVNLDVKMPLVIDACTDGLFASTNAALATNTLQVDDNDDRYRDALNVLKDLVQLGDAAFNRYLFGVWEDRGIVYEAAPTAVEYTMYLADGRVRNLAGSEVSPWNVRSGKWLAMLDLFHPPSDLSGINTMRDLFIEDVSYTMPYELQFNGAKTLSVYNKLARMGLKGESG